MANKISALPVVIFVHLLVIAVTTLVLLWLLHFREGLAFKSHIKQKIFNVHPLLMIIGFLLPAGEAIMAYNTIPGTKKSQKLFHLTLHFIALLAGIVGIYAVIKFNHEAEIPDMFTFHSWLGMFTICLFGLQWVSAFFSLWWPGDRKTTRARLAPWHTFFGMLIFLMAIFSAQTGLVHRFISLGLLRSPEALLVNFTGMLILLFGISVPLALLLPPGFDSRRNSEGSRSAEQLISSLRSMSYGVFWNQLVVEGISLEIE